MNSLSIKSMSTAEKLQAMEELWASLSQDDASLASPSWHGEVLNQTEERFKAGLEQPMDWTAAKEELRKSNK